MRKIPPSLLRSRVFPSYLGMLTLLFWRDNGSAPSLPLPEVFEEKMTFSYFPLLPPPLMNGDDGRMCSFSAARAEKFSPPPI